MSAQEIRNLLDRADTLRRVSSPGFAFAEVADRLERRALTEALLLAMESEPVKEMLP